MNKDRDVSSLGLGVAARGGFRGKGKISGSKPLMLSIEVPVMKREESPGKAMQMKTAD